MSHDWEGRDRIFHWKFCTKRGSKPHSRQRHRQSTTLWPLHHAPLIKGNIQSHVSLFKGDIQIYLKYTPIYMMKPRFLYITILSEIQFLKFLFHVITILAVRITYGVSNFLNHPVISFSWRGHDISMHNAVEPLLREISPTSEFYYALVTMTWSSIMHSHVSSLCPHHQIRIGENDIQLQDQYAV